VDVDIHDQWTSFEEYEAGSWNRFLERLKTEYPELTTEEQGSIDHLRKLCRENAGINLLEEERLMSFKRRFVYITQKCLRLLAMTENRELIELFVKTLDSAVTPYKSLGKLSDILHLNNRNNQLERRARPPPETFL